MRLKVLASAGALAALTVLAGCASSPQTPYGKVAGDYAGVLPCADCSGISTQLQMRNDDDIAGTYELRSVREGKSDQVLVTRGNFLVLENAGPQQLPLVYQLKGADGNTIYNLRPLDDGNLVVLDNEMRTSQSGADMTLKRR